MTFFSKSRALVGFVELSKLMCMQLCGVKGEWMQQYRRCGMMGTFPSAGSVHDGHLSRESTL
jgi:hypothetical protein